MVYAGAFFFIDLTFSKYEVDKSLSRDPLPVNETPFSIKRKTVCGDLFYFIKA